MMPLILPLKYLYCNDKQEGLTLRMYEFLACYDDLL